MRKHKYDVLLKILNMYVGVASKTRLVYPANLNFGTISHILNMTIGSMYLSHPCYASIIQVHGHIR